MELAQVGQLVGAFLSGGLAKSLLDHVLTDRRARRIELRPKDMERIAVVRTYVKAMDDARRLHLAGQEGETWRDKARRIQEMDVVRLQKPTNDAVLMLDDKKLLKTWAAFDKDGWKNLGKLHDGKTQFLEAVEADRWLEDFGQRLHERLNKLERRR